jgi:hypothetical protein
MQKDNDTVSPEQSPASASGSMWSRSVMRVDAGTSIALSAQAREDFHEPARTGNSDRFLAPLWMSASDDR